MATQPFAVFGIKNHFHKSIPVSGCAGFTLGGEGEFAYLNFVTGFLGLFFGHTHRGYFGAGVSTRRKCYELAPERVQQFLEEEIRFVLGKTRKNDIVLDLGCGYGRVAKRLAEKTKRVIGVDISSENIQLAKEIAGNKSTFQILCDGCKTVKI